MKKELLDARAELNRLNLIENENSQLEALLDIKINTKIIPLLELGLLEKTQVIGFPLLQLTKEQIVV